MVDAPSSSRTIAALVAYDGTDFYGFQVQDGVPTIQGALEEALAACTGHFARIAGSGRTDTGVHARGQVVSATVTWRHSLEALQRAWNSHLPPAVLVRRVVAAPPGFHPRFSATSRTYRYTVHQPVSSTEGVLLSRFPLVDRYSLVEPRPLDLAAMNQAAAHLVGEHDFATFGQPPQGESTVRRIFQAEWQPVHCDLPSLDPRPLQPLVFTVTANAFLRRMVRNLVGTLLEVGRGRRSPEDVRQALAGQQRDLSAPPAPARGLVLERVQYPAEFELFG